MDFLTGLTCLTLGTGLMISSSPQLEPIHSTFVAPVRTYAQRTNSQPNYLQSLRKTDVPATVKLLPYEIVAGKTTSYADISLTISNKTRQNIEVAVTSIEVVSSSSDSVLMSSTPQELKLPVKISLKPRENQVLEYRLKSESKLYQRGQKVMAQIRYQTNNSTEKIAQSGSEAVAFMIP